MESNRTYSKETLISDGGLEVTNASKPVTHRRYRLFLSIAVLLFFWLYLIPLLGTVIPFSASFALAMLCAALTFWLAETLTAMFVVLLPPALFIAGVAGLLLR